MQLNLSQPEVEKIIIEWAERNFPGMFNTIHHKAYGNAVELSFAVPSSDKKLEAQAEE